MRITRTGLTGLREESRWTMMPRLPPVGRALLHLLVLQEAQR